MVAVNLAYDARKRRGRWKRHAEGYLIISPWLIGFVFLTAGPMLASLGLSLTSYDLLSPPHWVALDNYRALLGDGTFFVSLADTLTFAALLVPAEVVFSLSLALLLNLHVRGIGLFRTLYYLPTVTPAVAAALVWVLLLNPDFGVVNGLLGKIGVQGPPWLNSPDTARPTLVLMSLWYVGSQTLVFLAALQGVREDLYDAASIDGAGVFRRFVSVTLPMITPATFFIVITGVIHATQVFTLAFIATQGGPADSTLFLVLYIYEKAFQSLTMGYASTVAWVLFLIVLALTVVQFRFSRWVYYEGNPTSERP